MDFCDHGKSHKLLSAMKAKLSLSREQKLGAGACHGKRGAGQGTAHEWLEPHALHISRSLDPLETQARSFSLVPTSCVF